MTDQPIPIQPVENPILCSPYQEPDRYWLYDSKTGIPHKAAGRRPAGYWYKTERTGSAQISLLTEEERDDLPLVNALRADVGKWRQSGWELTVLRPGDPDNYYEKFDLAPGPLRPELAKGKILVTNWHRFSPESEVLKVGGVTVGGLGPETPEAFAQSRLGKLWDAEPLLVLNDEGRHAYRPAPVRKGATLTAEEKADRAEATVWVSGLDKLNAACGIGLCVDLSATPFYIQGSGYPEGSPFPWIVSDFSLVDAIESGVTKIPRLPAVDNTGRPDPKYFKLWEHITRRLKAGDKLNGGRPKPEVVYRQAEPTGLMFSSWRPW